MSRDEESTRPDDGEGTPENAATSEDAGEATDPAGESSGGLAGRAVRGALAAVAWIVGLALIGLGLLGMARSPAGLVYLASGLLVTPRTRRELCRLCRLVCG